MASNKLSEKERLFCSYFVSTNNPRESASKAGFSLSPERTATKLLERDDIIGEIRALMRQLEEISYTQVVAGYKRLAFGSVADAVRLLYIPEDFDTADLENMDLFNIVEIKRPKGGGMEIKFFDRLKALEKLQEITGDAGDDSASPFYEALEKGALGLARGAEELKED